MPRTISSDRERPAPMTGRNVCQGRFRVLWQAGSPFQNGAPAG
ncbi:uncharacterized protein METZ01_LOCUS134982 [marine metagenome]|uniref:Uncharacterized protein n=1 Tax=marine metagenome TaxID=408172 RepID=A0A381YYN3_9ZZZZ